MKVKVERIRKYTYDKRSDLYTYFGICECGRAVEIDYDNYCGSCGSELDWSEVKELKEA